MAVKVFSSKVIIFALSLGILCLCLVDLLVYSNQNGRLIVNFHNLLPQKHLPVAEFNYKSKPVEDQPKTSNTTKFGNKKFIYLTQTEGCLNDYLSSPDVIGDPEICQCDVIVLSFKNKCTTNTLKHVEYLFNSSTSWTTGRNLVYKTAMARERKYMYYTLFDDDVQMEFKNPSIKITNSAWRDYELALVKHEPLIATSWINVQEIFEGYFKGKCSYPVRPDFLSFTWFDAMVSSYHYKAVSHILPYYEKMEATSIWYSQLYVIVKANVMFPGQIMHSLNSIVENRLHRPYQRQGYNGDTIKAFLPDLKTEIPSKYHKKLEATFNDWVKNMPKYRRGYYNSEDRMCAPFPEFDHKAVPYSYLD